MHSVAIELDDVVRRDAVSIPEPWVALLPPFSQCLPCLDMLGLFRTVSLQ